MAFVINPIAVNEEVIISALLVAFDLTGTFVFALSGAVAGVKNRLDIFGVLVLSFAAGNSGGIARDLMIGAVPPAALRDWRYLAVSILAGLITFYIGLIVTLPLVGHASWHAYRDLVRWSDRP